MIAALGAQINVPSVVGLGRIAKRRAFNAETRTAEQKRYSVAADKRGQEVPSYLIIQHSTRHTRTGLQQCSENYVQNNLYSFLRLTRADMRRPNTVIKQMEGLA